MSYDITLVNEQRSRQMKGVKRWGKCVQFPT